MQQNKLSITILGSGTSTGVPAIGCHCPVCSSTDPRNKRTRCSALISYGDSNILIDTSTDLRMQMLREDICRIDAVFYTHSHADHLHGIDDLRAFSYQNTRPLPLYGSETTLKRIETGFNYIFDRSQASGYIPQLELHPMNAPVKIGAVTIEPIPLRHGDTPAFGYRCGPLAYLTDCNAIPESSLERLKGLDLLVLDALRFAPHYSHFNIQQAIDMATRIGATQTLLTHLSHDVNHSVHDNWLPPGINLAYDGQNIHFPVKRRRVR